MKGVGAMLIMCFKDRKHCSWFIFDETNNLIPVPFGMIVYGYVANVLRMTDNGEIVAIYDDNLYDDILSNCFSKSDYQINHDQQILYSMHYQLNHHDWLKQSLE